MKNEQPTNADNPESKIAKAQNEQPENEVKPEKFVRTNPFSKLITTAVERMMSEGKGKYTRTAKEALEETEIYEKGLSNFGVEN